MVHLHTHSMFSLRDSIIRPEDLIERLKEIGQDTVAITDHGGSLGGVTLYQTLKKAGIRYIHGCEFYICSDVSVKDKDAKYYHLVALCKDETGRQNLNKLISISERPENRYFKPRIDFDLLSQHGDGLIIMSACLVGEISRAILDGDISAAVKTAIHYRSRFGPDYYLEIQAHNDPQQISVNREILKIAKQFGIPCVVTTDAHYTWEQDRKYQSKYAFNGNYKEDGEAYIDCFVQSEQEVRDRLSYIDSDTVDELIRNTHQIADRCQMEIPLSAPIMPKVDTPPEFQSNHDWLVSLCTDGFRRKLNIDPNTKSNISQYGPQHSRDTIEDYVSRYEYELNALDKMGFVDYILLVYSYASVGKRRGIARGSGGGALINYLTDITNIDPIEHGLYFERFIDVSALSKLESGEITAKELKIPDIDLDFSKDSCDEVLKFLYQKYGEDKVASIGKFGTNQTRGTIRDMCKVLGIGLADADRIAKSFDSYEIDEIDHMIAGELPITESAKDAISNVKQHSELFEYVRKLNGLPKSFGLHACGKIVSTKDLDYFLPSCYDSNGIRYLQGDMHDVEDMGLVKIDVLGLRTLDAEYDTLEQSGEGLEFLDPKQDYSDEKVLNIFRKGDTVGIFQMSSPGMKKTLKNMNVSGIEDLSAANALFRPGSLQYIDNYCRRKAGEEHFEYLHPDLEPILKNTYGIIVFQEQLIEIGRMAGLHNPDQLRKATGKKNPALLAEVQPELREKLLARGWSEAQFDKLWSDMLEFARYSFNKSHSSAYAIIAYMTAKQKAYYPAEFYCGLCNSYIGKSDFVKNEADEIIGDMMRHGIRIAPANFRNDHRRCNVKDGKVLWGIPLIRDCNIALGEILYDLRDTDQQHFWRVAKVLWGKGMKSKVEILVKLGFFHEYGTAKELLRVLDIAELFKMGDRKSIKKSVVSGSDFMTDVLKKYASSTNAKGEELSTFKILDCDAILDECEDHIKLLNLGDFDDKSMILTQREYIGALAMPTGKAADRKRIFVNAVFPLNRKSDGKLFGYNVAYTSIGSGVTNTMTIFLERFNKTPISPGDIIFCKDWMKDKKGYFRMLDYEKCY